MTNRILLHGWKGSAIREWEESGELQKLPLLDQGLKAAIGGLTFDHRSNGTLSVEQRRAAKNNLLAFTTSTFPQFFVGWHHRLLAEKLEKVYRGEIKRLMVNMPPRHGKSELVSRRFPAWVLGKNPNEKIVGCSYAAELASSINRDVQRIIQQSEYAEIFPNTRLNEKNIVSNAEGNYLKNSRIFEVVDYKGMYISAGVGGPITGKGFTIGIVDDPVKNREEADSKTYRDKVWDWWTSTFLTRGEGADSPGGEERIIVTLTRWHEDDLGGRILKQAKEEGEEWDIISLPVILDTEGEEYDPREFGEPLWPEKYSKEKLKRVQVAVGARDWEALYQQRPSPLEGGMFKREWWSWYEEEPILDYMVQSWDMAFKDASTSSYVVGQVWGVKGAKRYLLDQYRAHADFLATIRAFTQMCQKWPRCTAKLVEDKANGPAIIAVLKDKVSGIIPINPKGDKSLRAQAVTAFVQAGNIYLPRNKRFSDELIEEAAAFPTGTFDDQVDAMSQALTYLHNDPIREMEELTAW